MVRLTIKRPERDPDVLYFDEPAEVTVGRSASCNYCLDFDPMVSRMHAVFLIDPPSVRIKDLNSTNGMIINGDAYGATAVEKAILPVELHDGDEVHIGSTRIEVAVGAMREWDEGSRPQTDGNQPATPVQAEYDTDGNGAEETVANLGAGMPDIPGYHLIGVLARTGTGAVYSGVATDSGTAVAIKVVSTGTMFSGKMLENFRQEVESASRIQHPNIANLLDSGTLGGSSVFFVMEYVNGEDLASYLMRCPNHRIPLHNAYNIMLQLSGALCHLHRHGFVHKDIKPSSVILYDDNSRLRAKLTDMGYAHFMDVTGIAPRAMVKDDFAIMAYLAPEEITYIGEAKMTSDVFSLSAVFYEILSGKIPYNFGNGRSNRTVVTEGDLIPIEEVLPGLPEPLVVIVERGLSADADARYQSGCDLLEALENVW